MFFNTYKCSKHTLCF